MDIYNNLKKFLIDHNALVSVLENCIYIYNYSKIKKLNNEEAIIKTVNKIIKIKGQNLKLKKLLPSEILISGIISVVEFINE